MDQITVVNATGDANSKVAMATASRQFKVITCCRGNRSGTRIVVAHPFAHKEADKEHHHEKFTGTAHAHPSAAG